MADLTAAMASSSSYPDLGLDASSPTDSVIAGDFGSLSAEEQERQRDEWKAELARTEEEISTLKQVLASKEENALRLRRRLGLTQWREFSEMAQGLRNLQDSAAYKKTAETLQTAKNRTASVWSSVSNNTTHSWGVVGGKLGSAIGAAKSMVSSSLSHQNLASGGEDASVKEYEKAKNQQHGLEGSVEEVGEDAASGAGELSSPSGTNGGDHPTKK